MRVREFGIAARIVVDSPTVRSSCGCTRPRHLVEWTPDRGSGQMVFPTKRKGTHTAKFMFILHDVPGSYPRVSPEEMQRITEKYTAWSGKLRQAGKVAGSNKLMEEGGKILTRKGGELNVVDGPYSEAKEVVGGYFVVQAADYKEAIALARDCPHLEFGRIEVRQVDPMGCSGE